MKLFIMTLMIFSLTAYANAQEEIKKVEISAEKMELARAYEELTNTTNIVRIAVNDVLNSMGKEGDKEFKEKFIASLNMNDLKKDHIMVIANSFTSDEIKAMTDFYKTPIGQSIVKKIPQYSSNLNAVLGPAFIQSIQKSRQPAQ